MVGKKREVSGSDGFVFLPTIFLPLLMHHRLSPSKTNILFDAYAFQGGQNTIAYWTLVAATLRITSVAASKLTIRKRPNRDFGGSHCSSIA